MPRLSSCVTCGALLAAAQVRTVRHASKKFALMTSEGGRVDKCSGFSTIEAIEDFYAQEQTFSGAQALYHEYQPKLSELPNSVGCEMNKQAFYLFCTLWLNVGHFEWELALNFILLADWVSMALSRAKMIFFLLKQVQADWELWGTREFYSGCDSRDSELYRLVTGGRSARMQDTAGYLLHSMADCEQGRCTRENVCKGAAAATAWLSLTLAQEIGSEVEAPFIVSPCHGLAAAQGVLRDTYRSNEGDGNAWDLIERKNLFGSHWPVFPLLWAAAEGCAEWPAMGSFAAYDELDRFLDPSEGLLRRAEREARERLPWPWRPDFSVSERERLLQASHALHELCAMLSIPYALIRGPLLGATRHHGFLPWENDGDVCMPRERKRELVSLALAWAAGSLSDSCAANRRCLQVATDGVAVLRAKNAGLLHMFDGVHQLEKVVFYLMEDVPNLRLHQRGVHDPVIDVYFCGGWPGEAERTDEHADFDEAGVPLPLQLLFPLRRVFFAGMAAWTYREPAAVLDLRYGSWREECRSPYKTVVGKVLAAQMEGGAWPKGLPCEALDPYYSRVRDVDLSNGSRPGALEGLEGFDGRSRRLLQQHLPGVDWSTSLRSAQALRRSEALQFVVELELRGGGRLCEVLLRALPLAPSNEAMDFLWLAMPPLAERWPVTIQGSPALAHVVSVLCWHEPLQPASRPFLELP